VSFNSSKYEQLNLDSISQVGENTASLTSADLQCMDLGSIKAEMIIRDQKIKDLQSERTKLKGLIKRAKTAMDSINGKYKNCLEE